MYIYSYILYIIYNCIYIYIYVCVLLLLLLFLLLLLLFLVEFFELITMQPKKFEELKEIFKLLNIGDLIAIHGASFLTKFIIIVVSRRIKCVDYNVTKKIG